MFLTNKKKFCAILLILNINVLADENHSNIGTSLNNGKLKPINVGEPEIPEDADDMQIKSLVAGQKQLKLHEYLNTLPNKDWEGNHNYASLKEFQSTTLLLLYKAYS